MNAKQKSAKRKYMREYMRKYYHDKIKPMLKAQKSKAMKKLEPKQLFVLGKSPRILKKVLDGIVKDIQNEAPIKQPPPVYITDPEPPTCPSCGTLRIWKLQCPVCNRDHVHKPPSPKQSRVHIIEDGQPIDGDGE